MHAERSGHLCQGVNRRADLTPLDAPKVTHSDSGFTSQIFLGQPLHEPQPPYIGADAPCPGSIVRAHLQDGAVGTL